MKKSKGLTAVYIGVMSLLVSTIALSVGITLSLFDKYAEGNGTYGEVSLRSYFEKGSGRPKGTLSEEDPGDPYVITRPRHLYNLSRLQGLGVFGQKTYFQLGMQNENNPEDPQYYCYLSDSSPVMVPYLDMNQANSSYTHQPITAIGSEAKPFYSEFDGNNLEIKNLTVYADPEDAGLFGYTAHGSSVHNLFLSNITIDTLGYSKTEAAYNNLYGDGGEASSGTKFTYTVGEESEYITPDDAPKKIKELVFDPTPIFNWNENGGTPQPTISENAPVIGFVAPDANYMYKLLLSGDFLTSTRQDDQGNDIEVGLDLAKVYKFFKKQKADDKVSFPLAASSSVSLIASTTDNYGLEKSKVIMSFEFEISMDARDSTHLKMRAQIGKEHSNNIGLVVGHCDGSVSDCYVYNGKFIMNNGDTITGSQVGTYGSLANGSNTGLIGLVGSTVHNVAAEESDAASASGRDIGALDFSTIYDDIIWRDTTTNPETNSFTGSQSLTNGITYNPSDSLNYGSFLRKNSAGQYVTLGNETVSFNCKKVISNTDLGIFTVATNNSGTGMDADAENDLDKSVIRYERDSVIEGSSYYIYYETGEYDSTKGISFEEYRTSMKSDTPTQFFPGYHFPNANQVTSESFEQRDRHQNYVIRFKIDSDYREDRGFYMSDVDKNSPAGHFMSMYFENKLVDQNGIKIKADDNSQRSGVMLRDSRGKEIRKLTSSFATPDYSYAPDTLDINKPKMFCIADSDHGDPAANMVNFEVKTPLANVTVVAGLQDNNKPAALGVYKIDEETRLGSGDNYYIDRDFEDPDYAFFMPTDDHLAYFDYEVDGNGKGQIGTINPATGHVVPADIHTEATMPNTYEYSEQAEAYQISSEYGHTPGKTRLFAHTFKLPTGRYCLGSATGTSKDSGNPDGIAKIYYVCAQGQTEGQYSLDTNGFASQDIVKNIDFVKKEAYTRYYDEETDSYKVRTNIVMGTVDEYNANDPHIENQRLYVALANSYRSLFDAATCNIHFVYDDSNPLDKAFLIYSDPDTSEYILRLAANSYASSHTQVSGLSNTKIKIMGEVISDGDFMVYPPPDTTG